MINSHKRAHAVLKRLEREGLIPADLARLAIWRDLRNQNFHGARRAKRLLERFCERDIDPSGWIRALRDVGA
jgi:hypothetical protein